MGKYIKEVLSYVIIIVLVLLFKHYIISPIRVDGDSMNPTLKNGDIMLLNEIGYKRGGVDRFDIVVIDTEDDVIIKRVIGLPGDRIKYVDNKLYVNDKEVEEPFEHDVTHNFELIELGTDNVPINEYFVLGDNRNNSKDSRIIGFIKDYQIRGKVIKTVLFPFSRWGKVK